MQVQLQELEVEVALTQDLMQEVEEQVVQVEVVLKEHQEQELLVEEMEQLILAVAVELAEEEFQLEQVVMVDLAVLDRDWETTKV